jgi:hypothetical protein
LDLVLEIILHLSLTNKTDKLLALKKYYLNPLEEKVVPLSIVV